MSEAVRRATLHAVRPDERPEPPIGAPGLVLGGKYRLEEAIARGGMARVWRATHVTLNRPVAVKFVESFGATDDERVERFLREAKVAASVRHKNVVDIIDFGTWSTREADSREPYMVMELLEGETLDQRLVRGSMTNDEVVNVALQMLSGLDAVHRAGIVHRDLKPGNVFLTDDHDGVFARLLDFGISQGADDEGSVDRMVVGTPEYMSPEQAFGDPLDARSDLYSVGVVLYEMLSGVLPFEDSDPQKVVEMVAHGTPTDLAMLRPDAPELCAVVATAMSREPSDRYASARDMRRAILEAIGAGPDTTGRYSAVVRDSRVSGMHPRTFASTVSSVPPPSDVGSSPTVTELEPGSRSSVAPPSGGGRRAIAIGALALVVVTAAIVWAAATMSSGPVAEPASATEAVTTTEATTVAPEREPVAPVAEREPVAPAAEAVTAAPAAEPEPPAAELATEDPAAEAPAAEAPATEAPTERARPRRTAARAGIVRELDF